MLCSKIETLYSKIESEFKFIFERTKTIEQPKRSPQKRAQKTRAKLMAALENLLKEREFEQISIADIAKEAGVAVGSVYSHFKDKEAFLAALLSNRMQMLEARISAPEMKNTLVTAKTLPSLRDAMNLAARSAYAQVEADAHIMRALLTYIRLHPEELETRNRLAARAFDGVIELLEAYREEITRPDLTEAARMVNHFFNMIFLDKVLFVKPINGETITPNDEALIQGAADMAYGYLSLSSDT